MFRPDKELLDKYADLLVGFALNSGKGVGRGEVVQVIVPDVAKPFYGSLQHAVLRRGAIPLMRLLATGFEKDYYLTANEEQLKFFPGEYLKARVKLIDHTIGILAEKNLKALQKVPPQKMILVSESQKPYRNWLFDKEYRGKLTWTIGLYGTPAMAREAKMTLTEYWQEIIQACYLDQPDPIKSWKKIQTELDRLTDSLNKMKIIKFHMTGEGVDLEIAMGEKRKFVGGGGRNIPSYEVFTSPDWRGTEGYISFNQPLYRYGDIITDIRLEFRKGRIVKATAKRGQKILSEMIKRPNADKVGEFSLTDKRFSRIHKFMANTLYDENMGGPYGNTHIAIGMSYKDAYDGDPRELTKPIFRKLGFVDSGEHCDIVSTQKRKVDATLHDGTVKTIYLDGNFLV